MASEEMIQAINKHLTGDTEEFMELRERFEGCDSFQPHAAAALGYLIAKDELEAAKEKEEEPDVYDQVIAIINRFDNQRVNSLSPHSATDQIFTLIYEWLNKELTKVVYRDGGVCIADVNLLFQPFIIEKPEA
jgi:hypothetical protein